MKTPHRASSLCCHEPNDGRIAKLNHTPSMKAGQQSRHSCNQIPRGRHQCTGVQAGPEHKYKTNRGAGEAGRTETGTTTKEGRHTGRAKEGNTDKALEEQSAQDPSKARSEMRTERRRGVQQDITNTAKRIRSVQVHLSRLRTDTRVQKTLSSQRIPGRRRPQCTCHVYGQMHQWS